MKTNQHSRSLYAFMSPVAKTAKVAGKILVLVFSFLFLWQVCPAQIQVLQATNPSNQNLRDAPSTGGTLLTTISPGKLIVADGSVGGWYRCYYADPTHVTYGYALGGSGYLMPYSGAYVTVQNTFSSGLRIRQYAGTSAPNVTIGGAIAKVWDGTRYACTGNTTYSGGSLWYEVYLTNNCSPAIGWVSNGAGTGDNYLLYTSSAAPTSPSISVTGTLSFGSVPVSSSSTRTITIANSGSATLYVSSISCPLGFSGGWSGAISPGSSQNVIITFSPTSAVGYGGSVIINSNAPSGPYSVTCTGNGTSVSSPTINLSGSLSFGSIPVGSSDISTLMISNSGTSLLSVSSISYPSGFSGSWSGNISPGSTQNVSVSFVPSSAISYGGTITVNSNAAMGANTIPCSGAGTATPSPVIGLSGSLAFGAVQVATNSVQNLTITNTGSSSLLVTSIAYPAGFSGNWSGGTITAGNSKTVVVTFAPTSASTYGGNVTVNSNATAGASTIPCSGTGTSGATTRIINVSGDLSFGSCNLGNTLQRTLKITNNGNSPLNVASISYPQGFTGNWGSGQILAGGSKNVSVTFSPTSIKSYGGTVTINSDKTSGTNIVNCSGLGINGGGSSITIPTGLQATATSSSTIKLTWNDVGEATSYYVYNCDGTYLATTTSASFTHSRLSSNSNHSYKVAALSLSACSAFSECKDATTLSSGLGSTITIISPNGGESLFAKSTYVISGTYATGVTRIVLSYSSNNGGTFSKIADLKNLTNGNFSYSWVVPNMTSTQCKIKATAYGIRLRDDISDGNFTIQQCIATNDDYCYANVPHNYDCMAVSCDDDPSYCDPWGFYKYTCTSWAAWKVNQELGTVSSPYNFKNDYILGHRLKSTLGNAGNWGQLFLNSYYIDVENSIHVAIDDIPAVGAIAWYKPGVPCMGGSAYGHVAFVNCVEGSEVTVTEYNVQPCSHSMRVVKPNCIPTKYIHIEQLKNQFAAKSSNSLSIFPNPAVDYVKISTSTALEGEYTLNVINGMGTVVYTKSVFNFNASNIDISSLQNGTYYVRLAGNGENIGAQFQIMK